MTPAILFFCRRNLRKGRATPSVVVVPVHRLHNVASERRRFVPLSVRTVGDRAKEWADFRGVALPESIRLAFRSIENDGWARELNSQTWMYGGGLIELTCGYDTTIPRCCEQSPGAGGWHVSYGIDSRWVVGGRTGSTRRGAAVVADDPFSVAGRLVLCPFIAAVSLLAALPILVRWLSAPLAAASCVAARRERKSNGCRHRHVCALSVAGGYRLGQRRIVGDSDGIAGLYAAVAGY